MPRVASWPSLSNNKLVIKDLKKQLGFKKTYEREKKHLK